MAVTLLRSDKTLVVVAAVSSATVTVSSATVQHHLSGHSFAALLGFFGMLGVDWVWGFFDSDYDGLVVGVPDWVSLIPKVWCS
ncbi:hypothetical protein HanXRQr2_Chr07g0284861 [Helianthus annuus]|uniref:Uncharacterized protein n=1 Tax=Helianthus annuus TaxID=4232 RepID=A0A9K3IK25_HELAN|nr:hypothetical protein HanXRQr2_Chr07g0284861 [Helianthus annuus]